MFFNIMTLCILMHFTDCYHSRLNYVLPQYLENQRPTRQIVFDFFDQNQGFNNPNQGFNRFNERPRQNQRPRPNQGTGGRPLFPHREFFGNNGNGNGIFFEENFNFGNGLGTGNTGNRFTTQRPQFTTVEIPGMGTTRSSCEDRCQTTPQYNPVCGTDNITYMNPARLKCAQNCGKRVELLVQGACPRTING